MKKGTGKRPESEGTGEPFLERETGLQALLNVLPDLVFIINREGIFIDYHTPDLSCLLVPPSDFLGRHFNEVLPLDLGEKLELLSAQVLESGQMQSIEYSLTVSGKNRHFEARIVRYGREEILSVIRDITDLKAVEDALRESREKYRHLVDYAPTGIYEIDFWTQRIVSVNDAMCQVTGYTREEIISMNPMELLSDESKRLFNERLGEIMKNRPVLNAVEFTIKTKQGKEFWALLNIRFSYENGILRGATVVAQDISERKRAEGMVRDSENQLRSLMENARDFAIYRLVSDDKNPYGLRTVFVSPSIQKLMGISDPINFENWFKNIHPDDRERINQAQNMAFETSHFDEAARILHPQKNEWRWIQATSNGILDQDGRTMYINGIITDITEKKRAQEALQQAHDHLEQRVAQRTVELSALNEQLTNKIEEAKQIEKALGRSEKKLRWLSARLITTQENERKRISRELHDELGQSMIGLKFQLSNLPKKMKKEEPEIKEEIAQALIALDGMTENVRRLSRDLRPAVLEHLGLSDALQWLFDEGARKYGLKLSNGLDDPLFSFSQEQELIIFRIFQEALTNIGKHARAKQVLIKGTEKGGEALFSIQDNGRGFDLKEIIGSTSPERGLGLTTMDERVRMAGGTLSLWSRKGKGTTVTFTVPIKKGRKARKTA